MRLPGQLASGCEQRVCRLPCPALSLPGRQPGAPCFGLDEHHGFSIPSCRSSCWNSFQRQTGLSLGAFTLECEQPSVEMLGCVRAKPQSEHSAKQKLGPRPPWNLGVSSGGSHGLWLLKPSPALPPTPQDLSQEAEGPCCAASPASSSRAGGR